MNFTIDTSGQCDLLNKDRLLESDDDDVVIEDIGLEPANLLPEKKKKRKKKRKGEINVSLFRENENGKTLSKNDIDLDDFEREMGWKNKRRLQPKNATNVIEITKQVDPVDKVLEKSAIKPGFEKLETVPRYDESLRRLRIQRKREREKTKGKKWFNLPKTEITEEIKHDLEVIQMRSVLDPKHFYKKNDMKVLPKYFQIGKVVDSPLDYYNGRMTKKERKKTIVDELLADAEFSKFNKKKYKEIIDEKRKLQYKAHKHARRLKGKKK